MRIADVLVAKILLEVLKVIEQRPCVMILARVRMARQPPVNALLYLDGLLL